MGNWTYSGDPANSRLDELRFWVQDTDPELQLLSDEECLYLLGTWLPKTNSIVFTAAVACEVIAAKYTGDISVSADGVSVATSELQERYIRLAARLREQYKADYASATGPIMTGIMWDDAYDHSIKPLRFGIGFTDNAEAGRQDYGDYDPGSRPTGFTWNNAVWNVFSHPIAVEQLEP